MKLKLKNHWTTGETALQMLNEAFLRDTKKLNKLKITLNNRFQDIQGQVKEETTMADTWKGVKEALTSTCQEVWGGKKHHHIMGLYQIPGKYSRKKEQEDNN
ncbi:unnamed protein product [Schistosoma margrebowiei]|uniref:Uncharacterized protein n=1 Tax=Schistosoma margrebowiei TaxID=48269 RepID=A0A183MFE1_9TREM|nr:unnamed protein product [Schistosoma margrebowiei]